MKLRLRHFSGPFKAIFDEANLLADIRRSIYFMTLGNIFGALYGVICASGSTSITGYAEFLGANDFAFGVLNGIPLAAALLQIPFSILVSRTQKRKLYLMTFGVFSRVLWLLVGLIPFFVPYTPQGLQLWSVIFLIGISSACGAMINVCWMPWMADILPDTIRGRWLSIRSGISSVLSVLLGLGVAAILDGMPGLSGYALTFLIGGVLGVLDMVSFAFMKEVYSTPPARLHFFTITKQIFRDKPFVRFMTFWTLWCFTANLSNSYYGRYMLGEMGLSFMQWTLCSQVTAAIVAALVVPRWGRLFDRYGSKSVLMVAGTVAALTPAAFLFATYGSVWPALFHNFVGAAFWNAADLAATNMQLTSSPNEQRPSYIAFFSCFTSLFGSFLGVLTGGAILEGLQQLQPLGGIWTDRYKLLIALAVASRFIVVVLCVPKLANNRMATARDLLRDVLHLR